MTKAGSMEHSLVTFGLTRCVNFWSWTSFRKQLAANYKKICILPFAPEAQDAIDSVITDDHSSDRFSNK